MKLFGIATNTSRASNDAHAGWDSELIHRFAKLLAFFTFDSARNTAATRVVRHQDQVAACQRDKGGECRAFVAAFFFFDLNNQFLAFAQRVLNAG